MAFIEIQNLHKNFGKVKALQGFSAAFEAEKQYSITGSSGSGKSTLLYLLGGLDRPSSGKILIDGKDLTSFNDSELANFRNSTVGFVFQFHFLLPNMKCRQNMLLPAQIGGAKISNIKKKIESYAEILGVTHCLDKFPYELSGGEQQRVSIIRALSLSPKLLLCDEPTGNLDSENSLKVNQLIQELSRESGASVVVVTHDQHIAESYPLRLSMQDGKLL